VGRGRAVGAPVSGRARRWLPPAVTALVLAALAAYLYAQRGHIRATWSLRPEACAGIAALVVLGFALRAVGTRLVFDRLGAPVPWRAWARILVAGSASNYLPLSAGLFAKGLLLKRLHAVPYRIYAVGQAAQLLLVVATHGAVGLAALLLALPDRVSGPVAAGLAGMALAGALLFLPARWTRRLSARWFPWEASAAPALRRAWPAVAAVQLAVLLANAAGLWLAFAMGGAEVSLAACIVFNAASELTRLVSITPGALGLRELLIGALAALTGFALRDAVIAATLVRGIEVGVVLALGVVAGRRLATELAAAPAADPEPPPRVLG